VLAVSVLKEWLVDQEIRLHRVYATEIEALKEYVAALYAHDNDYDSMVNIEEGVKSLLRNEHLATPYFIKRGTDRMGYVILTKYHSVEKGGLTYYIDELYVEESKRRSGIGHEIMGKVLEIARADGAKTLWAQVERHNLAAQAFFTTHGFTVDPNINFERAL
jgi:ribosomal protein S18 acetylase RimI-like enzyme